MSWEFHNHDSTKEKPPGQIDVVWTSPPFDIKSKDLLRVLKTCCAMAKPEASLWLLHPDVSVAQSAGWKIASGLKWLLMEDEAPAGKPYTAITDSAPLWHMTKSEPGYNYWKSGHMMPDWIASKSPEDDGTIEYHPVPPELIDQCLEPTLPVFPDYKGLMFDPFCGRGTSVEAAHKLECRGVGYDINPEAVKIATSRCAAGDIELASEKYEPVIYPS